MYQILPASNKHSMSWNTILTIFSNVAGTLCVFHQRSRPTVRAVLLLPFGSAFSSHHNVSGSTYSLVSMNPLAFSSSLNLLFIFSSERQVRFQTEKGMINFLMGQRTYSISAAGKWWASSFSKSCPYYHYCIGSILDQDDCFTMTKFLRSSHALHLILE